MRSVLFLVLILIPLVAAVRFTEVFYDPIGDEYTQEYVEIYGSVNLSEYTFGDLAKNQSLVLRTDIESDYALIVSDGFDFSNLSLRIYTVGSRIGNGLGNTGDTIFLYFNNTLVDSLTYNASTTPEGYSLAWDGTGWKSEKERSPGRASNFSTPMNLSVYSNPLNCSPAFELMTNKLVYEASEQLRYHINTIEKDFNTTFILKNPYGNILKRETVQTSRVQTYLIPSNLSAIWLTAEVNLCNRSFHAEKVVAIKTHEKHCPVCSSCPQPVPCPVPLPCPAPEPCLPPSCPECPEVRCLQEHVSLKNPPPVEPLQPLVVKQVMGYDFTKTWYFVVGLILVLLLTLFVFLRDRKTAPGMGEN